MQKKVSIVIVSWNAKKFTQGCVKSIRKNTVYGNYEVIAVDNGSTDGSVEFLKGLKKQGLVQKLVLNAENMGFAFANNQGFDAASGEYIFMLNNDTLLEKGWLSNAVSALESNEIIGAVGSRLIGLEDDASKAAWKGLREKQTLCGAAMLIRKKALLAVGKLDAKNFSPAYGEETDWCYRARNSGFSLVEASDSVIRHFGSGSTLKQLPKPWQYELMNTHRLKAMLYNLSITGFLRHVPGIGLIFFQAVKDGMLLPLLKSYWNNLSSMRQIARERKKKKRRARAVKTA